jgi:hypothetical protein
LYSNVEYIMGVQVQGSGAWVIYSWGHRSGGYGWQCLIYVLLSFFIDIRNVAAAAVYLSLSHARRPFKAGAASPKSPKSANFKNSKMQPKRALLAAEAIRWVAECRARRA